MRYKLVREAIKTVSLLDGLTVIELDGKTMTRFKHWCGQIPKFAEFLKIYGEARTVTLKSRKRATAYLPFFGFLVLVLLWYPL